MAEMGNNRQQSKNEAKPSGPTPKTAAPQPRRLNFVLNQKAYDDLCGMSGTNRRSMTELVRIGLTLVKHALEAEQNGQRLVVANGAGETVKEIVLPL